MRIQLTLDCPAGSRLPLNYQYELSSWVYKTLAQAAPEFAAQLHEYGYNLQGHKRFKLFTFSHLDLQSPFDIDTRKQTLLLHSGKARLTLSFLLDKALEHFITGLFRQQRFGIGNARIPATDFQVTMVQVPPPPAFTAPMRFRTLSPICVAGFEAGNPHPQYRHPADPDYAELLLGNLIEKRAAAAPLLPLLSPAPAEAPAFRFRLLSEPRRKGITLKAFTPHETKVIGYTYDFEISAAPDLLQIGYYAGFGVENAQGFGCVGVV
ncbi:MAG: CRISPR-associated endoribonuclease Cas6 [Saprospiraceae bacterium]|nr:CRISPR-associated endoribonuclease Cas6 [Saprospiraceae bacterium]